MWLGRKWRAFRSWFGRQTYTERTFYGCGCLFALLVLPGCGFLGYVVVRAQYTRWLVYTAEDRAFMERERPTFLAVGAPSLALKLKAEVEAIPDPETATRLHPNWFAVRFPKGEWVFGHGVNSHGLSPGRNTLVMKDNTGRVRIFFGHVCGPNLGIEQWVANHHRTRAEFEKERLALPLLREWVPPP